MLSDFKDTPFFVGSKVQSFPPPHTYFSICEIRMHLAIEAVSEVNWQLSLSWWSIQ